VGDNLQHADRQEQQQNEDANGAGRRTFTAAEELLVTIMRRYERASTMLTSNRAVEDWGKLLGDAAAVSAMLDRLLHHGHVLKCGPRGAGELKLH
jgi:DNA replication protein DnaC